MSAIRVVAAALLMALPLFSDAFAQTIALDKQDATVWAQAQVVTGVLEGATSGVLHVGETAYPFDASGGVFAVDLVLDRGTTTLVACAGEVCSDPLQLTLGFTPRPEAELRAAVDGATVLLTGTVLENPAGGPLTVTWSADPGNPAELVVTSTGDLTATAVVPSDAPPGEYTVAWRVEDASGEAFTARTFVTVHDDGTVTPFVMETDAAAWVERAVIYGIAPFYFARYAPNRLEAITEKLPELAHLGVNTLWLQPIYRMSSAGQGYNVIDFFEVWAGFGTLDQLRDLVDTAHGLGMRVLFDLVPNHSSIQHPYAQQAIAHGPASHYYDFYQREFDSVPYAQHYNYRHEGEMTFVHYFWDDLVNFDYHNPEVRRHMIEASLYWVEELGIDGYRVDVAWGPDARNPEFFQEWRLALKRTRPDLLLLGEDKATVPHVFDQRFDAAYDWAPGTSWVSQWMWQAYFTESSNPTIFNYGSVTTRASRLRDALTNFGNGFAEGARVLRFMENNDTFRFLPTHGLDRTRMVAALLLTLPGIPMLYNGQEIGYQNHPYSTNTIFSPSQSIQAQDAQGLFPYYRHLLHLRQLLPALHGSEWEEVTVAPLNVSLRTFAFRRWAGDQHVVTALNMGQNDAQVTLSLPTDAMALDPDATYYVTDLMSGAYEEVPGSALGERVLSIPGHTAALFAVTAEPLELPVSTEPPVPGEPLATVLAQNYPNPFAHETRIAFDLGRPGPVRLTVYDVLGRRVALLVDGDLDPGRHVVPFEAGDLASGTYLYVLEADGVRAARRMLVVR